MRHMKNLVLFKLKKYIYLFFFLFLLETLTEVFLGFSFPSPQLDPFLMVLP